MPEHGIRNEKCLGTCQRKIKFVLTFAKNDQTLVEICIVRSIKFWPRHLSGFVQVDPESARKMSDCYVFHALSCMHIHNLLQII